MTKVVVDSDQARFNMIEQQIRPWNVLDNAVLKHLGEVRREDFVPAALRDLAFADTQLPLLPDAQPGERMLTPKLEARILQELSLRNTDLVLEVGTGSGFMTALLASRAEFVHSVEINPRIADLACGNLQRAGVVNAQVHTGDAASGWADNAPYDVIVLSGSVPVLPDALLQQLKLGGRLLAVVGTAPAMTLKRITRTAETTFETVNILETQLAPLLNTPKQNRFVF